MDEIQLVVFELNNGCYGTDALGIVGIERYRNVRRATDMPGFTDGKINFKGVDLPIVNLNEKFDAGKTSITKRTKIIITQIGKKQIGFAVNDVTEITKVTTENIEPSPEIISVSGISYIKGVAKKDGRLITIIYLKKILTDNEINKLYKEGLNV